ncbi:MAG: glucokinase, partial [Alphaproteobacteria bacterium]
MSGLVADIGGTNARFAIVEDVAGAQLALSHARSLKVAEHATLAVAMERYLEDVEGARPSHAALAVACPVVGDRVRLTNNAWQFSQAELADLMGFERLLVMNDFVAQARALPYLKDHQLAHIRQVPEPDLTSDTLAVLGPGTGLGVAGLHLDGERHTVFTSEGGHMAFAALDDVEYEIVKALGKRYERVSYERLLSGQGLRNLYEALAQVMGVECEPYDPTDITSHALANDDSLSRSTLERFCAILGSFAGDVALMLRARHVYLTGGILPRFIDFLKNSDFRARFEAKGRFADLMRRTPVSVIV